MADNLDANTALERLKAGNARFASNVRSVESLLSQTRRSELANQQAPFAIVLGCSDSRAPAEILFDQGLGDLFVIRVAGNVVAPSQVGSVEFAAARFGVRLVVVMGHTGCGAIAATIEAVTAGTGLQSEGLTDIIDRVRPAVETLIHAGVKPEGEAFSTAVTRSNVRMSADHLRHGSPVLEKLARSGLRIVGAEYDLMSGAVDFFDLDKRV
jgi:carbonic anhydrase